MGCFTFCFFGYSKDKKRRKERSKVQAQPGERLLLQRASSVEPTQYIPVHVQDQDNTAGPVSSSSVSETRDIKPEEKLSCAAHKKVTFDSNIRTYDHVSSDDKVPESASEIGERGNAGEKRNIIMSKSTVSQSPSEDVWYASSVGSRTPNNRYENCRETDDDEDLGSDGDENGLKGDELDGVCGDDLERARQSCDQTDRSMSNKVTVEKNPSSAEETETNVRDRSVFVHRVLNPIENLTQWKAAKAEGCHKEESWISFGSESAEPNGSSSREVSVDASLSSWLVSSESTPVDKKSPNSICSSRKSMCQGSNSPFRRNRENRPILGALTVEELRQFSATNCRRKSPSRSPDDMAIIGTVGTYWNPSIGSANSNSRHSASTFKKGTRPANTQR
ncbi:hypothetical protein SAY86_028108 [Trapa natans]|uniref:Uncharacterized protein n=1 Tax=Trapa natans TaxID=22666 RepID=A0AAN7RAF4_TRANT|nr:hypothetical protein SAY86_028108 [Trapa natans]